MTQYSMNPPSRRRPQRWWVASLAVLFVGSVGFAAAGGVAKLKSWLVKVEVNGAVTEVQTDENGEASFTVDTEQGPAHVFVRKWDDEDGEQGTQVRVRREDGGGLVEEEEEKICVRTSADAVALESFSLETLGDAEPIGVWETASGAAHSVYLIPQTEGPARLFLAIGAEDAEPDVHLVGQLPPPFSAEGADPQVEVDEDGLITVTLEDDTGNVMVAKLKMRIAEHPSELSEPLALPEEIGDIKIGIEEIPADE